MNMDIIQLINHLAFLLDEQGSEQELDEWLVPQLIERYVGKLNYLTTQSYGFSGESNLVAQGSFKEQAKTELRSALKTFLFKEKHWRTGRDINTYLLKTLNRLADRIRWDTNNIKKVNSLVCPGCKFLKKREFLHPVDLLIALRGETMLKCNECSEELERVQSDIRQLKNTNLDFVITLEGRLRLFRSFAVHSRKGYKCPDCGRFIPKSCNGPHGICCPYIDCVFSGKIQDLTLMNHPVGLTSRIDLSLQTPIDDQIKGAELQDTFVANDISSDVYIEVNENLNLEINTLQSVIDEQLESVKRTNAPGTILQKCLMYEAYINMLQKHPEDMVSYLVHRKQVSEYPLQARIFQEYVRLMQDALPYTINKGTNKIEVVSLLDPNISLFEGVSVFDATVNHNHIIPNNTRETYVGGRKFKCYGPCFIGTIIDIVNRKNNKSLRNYIQEYGFVQIKMKPNVLPDTPVLVTHYRIPSHYEMGSLVYLQRIRKRIVDKVYFKMHGAKRETKCA